MAMVNPDDVLEMAATRYFDLIVGEISRDDRPQARGRVPTGAGAKPVRLAVAALLRRLADVLQAEPEAASANRLAVSR